MSRLKDLTGMKFGRLTVICRAEDHIYPSGKHEVIWKCLCDCQMPLLEESRKYTYVLGVNLKSGQTQSCGCLQKERTSKAKKKYNEYDLSGEYGIGYTSKGEEFWFDLEDYDKIKNYCWVKREDGYFIAYNKNTTIRLNRIIMDVCDSNIPVDHIKQHLYDNRKSQLRVGTKSKNGMNHKIFNTNKSGCTGVFFADNMNSWCARITVNYKDIILGYFNDYEDAVEARKEAEEKYFGEWSYDNSQKYSGD